MGPYDAHTEIARADRRRSGLRRAWTTELTRRAATAAPLAALKSRPAKSDRAYGSVQMPFVMSQRLTLEYTTVIGGGSPPSGDGSPG